MKNIKNPSSKLYKASVVITAVLAVTMLLSSCLKTYTDPRITNGSHTVFVNAIPNSLSFLFYLDNFQASNQSIGFTYSLPAIYVSPGVKKLDLVLRNSSQSILTDTIQFRSPNYFTIFATGKTTPEFVVIEDTQAHLVNPPTGKAKIRFINLSSDAPNLDVAIEGGAKLFTDVTYKANTEFINIDPGDFYLNILQTGTSTVKFSKHVLIVPDRVYNIFSLGAWDVLPGDAPLDLGLMDALQ